MPPEKVAVMVPVPPLHDGSALVSVRVMADGWVSVLVWVAVHPLASFTTTVWVVAVSPVNWNGDVAQGVGLGERQRERRRIHQRHGLGAGATVDVFGGDHVRSRGHARERLRRGVGREGAAVELELVRAGAARERGGDGPVARPV